MICNLKFEIYRYPPYTFPDIHRPTRMFQLFEDDISVVDSEVSGLLEKERERVRDSLQLIPSENFASRAVLEATGSITSNKYAEGYPGKRYYEGNEFVDGLENLARDRATALFGADHANVQVLSGGPANMCVFAAILEDGDKVLSMDLAQGGHLTHGATVNFSGQRYEFHHYPVDKDTHKIDYEVVRARAKEVQPKLIIAGASAYPREINFDIFRQIADEVGALLLADISHIAGLVAAGVHPEVHPHAHIVTSTTHKTLRGPRGAVILCEERFAKAIDKAVFPQIQAGPHMNSITAKAVAFHEAAQPSFKAYAKQVVANASTLSEELMGLGWKLTTGGTDNHLMVMDLREESYSGHKAAKALANAGIVTNKNMVPYDERSPMKTSGVRLGTPAMTSRGMKEVDMKQIAQWIDRCLKHIKDEDIHVQIASEIQTYLESFPIYSHY